MSGYDGCIASFETPAARAPQDDDYDANPTIARRARLEARNMLPERR